MPLSSHPCFPVLIEPLPTAGRLRSTDVTPLPRYYEPLRHPLVFPPTSWLHQLYGFPSPPLSRRDEEGFSSCSTCPCHRAVPTTPPECHAASVSPRPAMLPSPRSRGLGLRIYSLSRPPVGSLALRPGDSLTIPKMALSVGFIRFVSSTDATPATGLRASTPVGLSPTEHASLRWTHCSAKNPSACILKPQSDQGHGETKLSCCVRNVPSCNACRDSMPSRASS